MLVILYHFRKCGGTSVRNMFHANKDFVSVDQFGATDLTLAKFNNYTRSHIFWERHTNPHFQNIEYDIPRFKSWTKSMVSITVLRHPIDLILSEYHYFHKKTNQHFIRHFYNQ